MFHFNVQTFFLLAIAYLLGALIGCWLRKMFAESASKLHHAGDMIGGTVPAAATAAAAATATGVAAKTYVGEGGEASVKISRGRGHVVETPIVPPVAEPVVPVYHPPVVERETIIVREPEPVMIPQSVIVTEPAPAPAPTPVMEPEPEQIIITETVVEPEPLPYPEPSHVIIEETVLPAPTKPVRNDDLTKIKGIGLPVALELKKLGISRFEQVARWTDADVAQVSRKLGFSGRIERENWMGQADILLSGNELEFTEHQLDESQHKPNRKLRRNRSGERVTTKTSRKRQNIRRGDDFRMISGIDSHIARQLKDLGIIHFSQIAHWTPAEVAAIGRRLNVDEQRIDRENWLAQARQLAASDKN